MNKKRKDGTEILKPSSIVESIVHQRHEIILALILLFSFLLTILFYYGVAPVSGSDNYIYSSTASSLLAEGPKAFLNGGEDISKVLLIASIAFFYKIFGVNRFSGALFGIITFLGTSLVLYLIGKEIYNKKAGLLAAFLYSIFPLAVTQASTVGDNGPMAFFVAVAFYLFLLGRKEKRRVFLLFSGFISSIGFLITPEEVIVAVPIVLILLFDVIAKRKKEEIIHLLEFCFGLFIGIVAIMIIGYLIASDFLYIYEQIAPNFTQWCARGGLCTNNIGIITSYLSMIFPYHMIAALAGTNTNNSLWIPDLAARLLNPAPESFHYTYNFGFYYYFTVIAILILLIKKEKKATLPSVWLAASFLYLCFGTMSLERYVPLVIVYPRITLIFAPPMALLLSFGLIKITETKKRANAGTRIVHYIVPMLVVSFLVVQSIYLIMVMQYSWYNVVYKLISVGSYVDTLPTSTPVFMDGNIRIVLEYTDYLHNVSLVAPPSTKCDSVMKGSYFVMLSDQYVKNICNFSVSFVPSMPSWLLNYSIYDLPLWSLRNITVYYRN